MSAPTSKSWRLLPHDRAAVERLSGALELGPIVAQLLLNRGLSDAAQARRFLDAALVGLHPPDLLPGVTEATDRILAAIQAGRRLCVYGDYDADGITGSAILLTGLKLMGAAVDLYVPHRLEEGYGLNLEALRQIASTGVSLIVTVDCGIASLEEAREARRLGLELIVTDHHEFKDELPEAAVLVHPRLPGAAYPFGKLSGSAVAFKLAWALAQRACGSPKVTPRFRDYLLDSVALAALGVVADVVPLHDENRILVRHGLHRLRQMTLPGLQALCACAGLTPGGKLRAADIGYKIAPRLNAAGRLGCARLVVDLLTTPREEQAMQLARYLEEQNTQRQTLERRMVSEARKLIEEQARGDDPALVLVQAGWHAGIIGIVAGRLVDLYGRPTLLIALPAADSDGRHLPVGVGSGRSVPGFALHEALRACDDLLLGHGGHAAAAGLRILPENIDAFRHRLCERAAACFPDGLPAPTLVLDAEVPLSMLTTGLLADLDRLEPYGAENRRPLFLAGGLQVKGEPRKVGAGERHLSFRVSQQGTVLKAIAWSMAERAEELMAAGGACCLAFTPRLNEWQGLRSVDLEVADFQAGAQAQLA
ncbi:MAG TPA: single-stranded-DNA-specific exonuclease RecJ [Gemmataceae bacterium]|nr:single-stranded-DNA-specific exonuclease RecJ [Gemmataceae bacterium]